MSEASVMWLLCNPLLTSFSWSSTGFRRSTESKGRVVPGSQLVEVFRHPHFVRGRKDLLQFIQRKATAISHTAPRNAPVATTPSPLAPHPPTLAHTSSSSLSSAQQWDTLSVLSETPSFMDTSLLQSTSLPDPHTQQAVVDLQHQTAQLQQEVALLRAQNTVLASQQEQQSLALQAVMTLLSQLGITMSAPEIQRQQAQFHHFEQQAAPQTLDASDLALLQDRDDDAPVFDIDDIVLESM